MARVRHCLEGPKVANRAINRAGDMARTQVVRTLAVEVGLPQKTIRAAVQTRRSDWDHLSYTLESVGGDVSLRYFKKRETRDGVVAYLGRSRGNEEFIGDTFFRGSETRCTFCAMSSAQCESRRPRSIARLQARSVRRPQRRLNWRIDARSEPNQHRMDAPRCTGRGS
ncbi:hypothetical protein MACH17_15710 [Phaeobacter inhibens]|nr:hypothetical protein MACH17_15710 [Phaeobacter inhibens]